MKNFEELSLPLPLQEALAKMQFTTPTPIQAQAIPFALAGEDILGSAQTGTGKTAAFCIPILAQMLNDESNKSQALILAPTRELAQQIEDVVKALTQCMPQYRTTLVVGGLSMFAQVKSLHAKPRIIVATPGRAIDHLKRGSMRLDQVRFFVLDEVDRMLDIGFAPQLLEILRYLPKERQTFFFSATLPTEIERIAKRFAPNPKRVSVGQESQPVEWISQRVIEMPQSEKVAALLDEVNAKQGSAIVFTRTQRRCERLAYDLKDFGLEVALVHGGRSQGQRNSAMKAFREGEARILVATDVAARGIDISALELVVNFDVPQFPEDYVHRIGRTGRAGASGEAVSFVSSEERGAWKDIQKFLEKKKAKRPVLEVRKSTGPIAKPEKKFAPKQVEPQDFAHNESEEMPEAKGPISRAPMGGGGERQRERSFDRRERNERSNGGARDNRGAPREGGFRKPFGDRKPFGEKKSFGDRKPYGDRKPFGDKKPFGDRKPFGEKKSFGDRKPYGEKKSFGDRKPYGDRKPFGDKKPFGDRKPFGERKAYGEKREFTPRNDQASYGEREPMFHQKSDRKFENRGPSKFGASSRPQRSQYGRQREFQTT